MKREILISFSFMMTLFLCLTVQATDLPIDISAIGRQETSDVQITERIGANLFTDDAQRINDLLDERIQLRQESVLYLFDVPHIHEPNPHAMDVVGLFVVPLDFSSINMTQINDSEPIPLWVMVLVFSICATLGFIWAMFSRAKKREREKHVH